MATSAPPIVECDQVNAVLIARDISVAVDFYTRKLGFKLGFLWGDPPTYAGVNLGKVRIFLKQGMPEPKECEVCFLVGDADQLYEFHHANGVELAQEIGDREYGIRDYSVRDLNGYYLTFGHHLLNTGEPIKIKRVEVPMRIEKRLAALLEDLAKHKRMSLGSCLEEILLHTNEGVEPHTQSTLRYIEELKKKHGINYDSHGSYRFVEE